MAHFMHQLGLGGAAGLLFGFLAVIGAFALALRMRKGAPAPASALVKKAPAVDLRRYSSMFFAVGLTFSLLAALYVFEYPTYEERELLELSAKVEFVEEQPVDIPPTEQKPPPPPKIVQPKIVEVADVKELEQEIEIMLDVEIDEETAIEPQQEAFDLGVEEEVVEEETVDEIFEVVEESAAPVGGYKDFYAQIAERLEYPKRAERLKVSGRVFLQFVVEKDGSIAEIVVARGIGAGCDEEAVRVLSQMPDWKPGKQRGVAVRQRMTIPIFFKLLERPSGAM